MQSVPTCFLINQQRVQCYFRFNYAVIYVQHLRIWIQYLFGLIFQKKDWRFTFDHLFFLIARWRWLPDCRSVFEEGVWQPRDLRLEVLGGWEVYPRSQGSAENQVHCTTLDRSFCAIEDWDRADNWDALWRHKHKIEIKIYPVTICTFTFSCSSDRCAASHSVVVFVFPASVTWRWRLAFCFLRFLL